MNTKIRLVKCPKCRLILPELPDFSLYKCGVCNTVLQAKHRKPDMKEVGFDYHGIDENGLKEGDHVSGYTNLKKDTSSIALVDESSAQITTQVSDKYGDSSPDTKKERDKYDSVSSQDIGRCGDDDDDNSVVLYRGKIVSGFSTSMELTSNEMEDSSLELQPYLVTGKGIYDTEKREHFEGSNFSNDIPISSPESGVLNKRRDKIVHLSRQDKASSNFSCHNEAENLLNAWTYNLQGEESDSTNDNQSPLADKVSPDVRYVLPTSVDSLSNLPIADPLFGFSGPTWNSRPPRRKLKHPASVTSDIPPKQSDKTGVLKSLEMHHQGSSHESEVLYHVRKSAFLEANCKTSNYANYNQEKFPETGRYGHYSVCRSRQQNEESVPRLPRDLQAGPKNYVGFRSPDTPLYSGPDKLELLKKINELKDEIKRTRISDRFSSEQKHNPTIYERVCFRCQVPQTTYMSRHGTCVCLHCLPQGYHYSGGLPLHNMCCNDKTDRCLDRTCQSLNKGCWSLSSSHQLHSEHQLLHDHKIKSDNRMHRETKGVTSVRCYMRHTAGGSPIISCYHCSKLLQLPADFVLLHGRRRSHRLKCNACSEVMTFSIQGGKHLVPCIPESVTPPPSMVDDCYNGSFDRRAIASSSSSYPNKYAKGKYKELSPTSSTAAALHRLMGYSSPSHVIKRRTTKEQLNEVRKFI